MALNVYQIVTDRIIEELEKGLIPWKQPWKNIRTGAYNRITKKPYSLLNQLMLRHSGEYATFKQWTDLGGKIKKGSKSEIVVFWKFLEEEVILDDGTKEERQIPFLRYYNVFHISCVEGVEPLKHEELQNIDSIEEADAVIQDYIRRDGLTFTETLSNEAFYRPFDHSVTVPCKGQYENINEYYSTTFHELGHSTSRYLKRPIQGATAGHMEGYSKEELIAEITSCMILNLLNIETADTFQNSTAYIQNWLQVLKNDNHFIVSASGKAEKAVQYIMNM